MQNLEGRSKNFLIGLGQMLAIILLTSSTVQASAGNDLLEGQKQIGAMTESGRKMVMQINQAAASRTKAEILGYAKEAIRFGEETLEEGQKAMTYFEQAAQGTDATPEIRRAAYRSMEHLEMAMLHVRDAIYIAKASLGFRSFQNLLGAIQESATHARHAGLHILSEDHAYMGMEHKE